MNISSTVAANPMQCSDHNKNTPGDYFLKGGDDEYVPSDTDMPDPALLRKTPARIPGVAVNLAARMQGKPIPQT